MAIAIALVSSVSSMVMAGPRVYAAMAEDRALPQFLSRRSARGAPINAIVTQTAMASCLVALWNPDELIRYVGFGLALFSALTASSVFVLRRRVGTPSGAYRTPGYPVTPLLFIVLSGGIASAQLTSAASSRPREFLLTIGTFIVGAIAFVLCRQSPEPAREDDGLHDTG
jgi:basic amino acid/polyamine antiporter, APA family